MSSTMTVVGMESFTGSSNDHEWIEKALSGDQDAFGMIIRKHRDSLFDLAVRLLGNRAEAEDILQAAFLKAWRHLKGFQKKARLSTWLYSIVLNLCRNALRHRKIVYWQSLDALTHPQDDEPIYQPADRGPSIEKQVGDRMDLEALQREVRKLSVTCQAVFDLYYFQNLSVAEVGRKLGRPEGTIKVYLHRARRRIHKAMTTAQIPGQASRPMAMAN